MKKFIYSIFAVAAMSLASCGAPEGEETTEGGESGETTGNETETPAAISGTYATGADAAITWKAKHYADEDYVHVGTVPASGNVVVDNNMIVGGEFTLDILGLDEEGETEYNQMLEGHLLSPDFFNVEAHPAATFKITGSEAGKVTGTLNVIGVEQEVTIEGTFTVSENEVIVEGSGVLNMLTYNMPYFQMSENVEESEKGQSANPDIVIEINMTLTK